MIWCAYLTEDKAVFQDAAAIGVGGLLGPLPVFSALAAPIAEGIRDA